MLAIRCCRNCGKEFDAVVGEDNNIFCEECREVMLFFSDGRYKEEGDCGRIALVSNHPFLDGNKRTGAHVMLTFLLLNGVELEYTQTELIEIILKIASSQTNAEELSQWNIAHKK